jgi:hypothetical protein
VQANYRFGSSRFERRLLMSARKNFGQRIHEYLAEPPGEQFVMGKFRFWLPAILFLSVLNAILTALIFKSDDSQANYSGAIMLSVGALLAWLCIGCLHYSDSTDRRLARGVAGLDSLTLLFVVCHFAGLMYAYGHLQTIRSAERKYEAAVAIYNAKAEKVSTDNVEIARAAQEIEREKTKRAKIENDSIYQARKAAEAGAKIDARGSKSAGAGAPGLSTSAIELERPVKPEKSSAQFLGEWDWLIRAANLGELLLAALTLIFIRNQSAKTNTPAEEDFPDEIDAGVTQDDRSGRRLSQTRKSGDERNSLTSGDSFDRKKARLKLLENLKVISSYHYGYWFRVELLDDGGVKIRMSRRVNGVEETVATTRQSDKLLRAVDRPDFLKRLVDELIHQGFPIEKEKMSL